MFGRGRFRILGELMAFLLAQSSSIAPFIYSLF
jgi:hypothetical protein